MNEAEKLADKCDESAELWLNEIYTRHKAAALLRRQAEQIRELREALEGVMEGCAYQQIQGEWAWHEKTMPTNAALTRARTVLSNTKEEI